MAALTRRLCTPVVFAAVAVLVLAGCGNSDHPGAAESPRAATTTTSGASWSRPDNPPDPHTLLRAGATAVAKVPEATLTFIESETDDAGTWKVRVVTADGTEQQLKIAVDGITVLVGPTPKDDSEADKAKRRTLVQGVQGAQLDYRAAVDKMVAAVPNGSITELTLADTDGTAVWQGNVWDVELVEHEVTVNAASGQLVADKQV